MSSTPSDDETSSSITFFTSHPLTAPLLSDPSYNIVNSTTNPPFLDPLLATVTRSHTAIRHTLYIYRASAPAPQPSPSLVQPLAETKGPSAPSTSPEGHLMVHIGPSVCGQSGVAHGGFLATVMHEVCGALVPWTELDNGLGIFTVSLKMECKAPVFVPAEGAVILASGRVEQDIFWGCAEGYTGHGLYDCRDAFCEEEGDSEGGWVIEYEWSVR